MPSIESSGKIKTKLRGNKPGFLFFKILLQVFGLKGAYGFLYIVCIYYLLFDRSAVDAALSYIIKRFPEACFYKKHLHAYRLFISQGKQLIDRYALISGCEKFDFRVSGYEQLVNFAGNSEKGFILLTSHVGNWQIALATLNKIGKTVYLLMRPEDNPAVKDSLHVGIEQGDIKIISPDQYLGGIIEIMNVLNNGHIVSIMGDRSYGVDTLDVLFLGASARFPYSAFAIAASAECPIVVLSAAKVEDRQYAVDFSNALFPVYKGKQQKKEQLQVWLQEFVELIEVFVNQYPYQCFLFYDVWNKKGNQSK